MAYVLVPPLPPGMRKSDYRPLGELLRTREQGPRAKGKARVGDNSGSTELVAALQGAFKNNSLGAGSAKILPTRRRKEKQKAVDPVDVAEVVGDEDKDDGEGQSKGSTDLAVALAKAFIHNSADPKVAAPTLARPVASGSTRRSRKTAAVETLSDSASVEVVLPPPTKRTRAPANVQVISDADDNDLPASTRVSSRRKGKLHPRMSTNPRKKRQRMVLREAGSDTYAEEQDEEVEIVTDAPQELRRATRSKPRVMHGTPQSKFPRATQRHRPSTPSPAPISIPTSASSSPPPSPPAQSEPARQLDVNTLAGLPLTILPAPTSADIVIPPRALSHLHPLPSSPNLGAEAKDTRWQKMTQRGSLKDFCDEEAAEGAHGLLTTPAAAVATMITATTTDSSPSAPTTDTQHPILELGDIIVPMDIDDQGQVHVGQSPAADRAAGIMPTVPPHALRISGTDHPDGPMLGSVLSEHDGTGHVGAGADTGASRLGIAVEPSSNMVPNLEFMLATLNSSPGASAGWIDWCSGKVLGAATMGVGSGMVPAGEFAGDGTIDPSVLGGGAGGSPGKLLRSDSDRSVALSGPLRSPGRVLSRALGDDDHMDLGDEEDVMGLLFQDPTDGDFVPSSSLAGKTGKGKSKAVDGTKRAVTWGARKRRKSWRKARADSYDDTVAGDDDRDHDKDQDIEGTPPASSSLPSLQSSELTFCHHCRRKTRRPKMRCTQIRASTGEPCRKLFCDLCIEKRCVSPL
jgi:hypothetical protein